MNIKLRRSEWNKRKETSYREGASSIHKAFTFIQNAKEILINKWLQSSKPWNY